MALTLLVSISIPYFLTTKSRKLPEVILTAHFKEFLWTWCSQHFSKTFLRLYGCFSVSFIFKTKSLI